MKEINQEDIENLPVHDSDFLGFKISQRDNGDTDLIVSFSFCEEEIEIIPQNYKNIINNRGEASFYLRNCRFLTLKGIYNYTKRDSFDYINFIDDSELSKKINTKDELKHIQIVFVSGSVIECVFESILLTGG